MSSQCKISVIVIIKPTTISEYSTFTDKLEETATKRKLVEEFDSVSAATLSESANIHGVVANVSLMKPGKICQIL